MKIMEEKKLLTIKAAAEIAGVTHTTVGKWIREHGLRTCRMPGSCRRRIRQGVLIAFLDSLDEDEGEGNP